MTLGLGGLTWPELAYGEHLLAVPTGSCEQHGPHLPLDTDTLIAQALASRLAKDRADVLVAPPIGIGASGEHRDFPGTLSIGTEVLGAVLVELARSALPEQESTLPSPFSAVLFVNGHGGNVEALTTSVNQLRREGRKVGLWHPRIENSDPHAGHTETSLMLHLHPEHVRMELAVAGSTARFSEIGDVLATDGLSAVSANGVLGDPTAAKPDDGAQIFAQLASDLRLRADELVPPAR